MCSVATTALLHGVLSHCKTVVVMLKCCSERRLHYHFASPCVELSAEKSRERRERKRDKTGIIFLDNLYAQHCNEFSFSLVHDSGVAADVLCFYIFLAI